MSHRSSLRRSQESRRVTLRTRTEVRMDDGCSYSGEEDDDSSDSDYDLP